MKAVICFVIGCLAFVAGSSGAFAAQSCDFDIVGTWESSPAAGQEASQARYRFEPNGTVISLMKVSGDGAAEWRERTDPAFFLYRLDKPKAPSAIELIDQDGKTSRTTMKISRYDQDSFTTLGANDEPMPWVRVDAQRHFVVFAGRAGSIESGGPSFAMLITTENGRSQVDAFGFYPTEEAPIVGPIPGELRRKFLNDPRVQTDVMLRVEVTGTEFARAQTVMRNWERRANENKMLYDVPYLNNIVFLEELTQSLNRCGEKLRAQKLTWNIDDPIISRRNLPQVSYYYIKELRQLNSPLHVADKEFRQRTDIRCAGSCG
jgi:hypothetical protein